GAQRDGRVTPAETDVGMMSFGFGKLADPLHKGEHFPEIAKSKRALDAAGNIPQYPLPRPLLRFVAQLAVLVWTTSFCFRRARHEPREGIPARRRPHHRRRRLPAGRYTKLVYQGLSDLPS